MSEDVTQTEDVTTDVAPAPDYGDWKSVSAGLAGENTDLATELSGYESFDAFLEAKSQPAEFDWRAALSGDDEKLQTMLSQYKDPLQAGKAFGSMRDLIGQKSGNTLPGEDATDEQIRAFKQANGIPEKPDGYENLPEPPQGLEVSDEDKAFLGKITETLHGAGALQAHPEIVATSHELYYQMVEERDAMMDAHAQRVAEDTLAARKASEGGEMKANTAMAKAAVTQFFGVDDPDDIFNLRLADGSFLGAHPQFVNGTIAMGRYMMGDPVLAKTMNFDGTNGDQLQTRYDELLSLRHSDKEKYGSAEVQDELRSLKKMMARTKQRAA